MGGYVYPPAVFRDCLSLEPAAVLPLIPVLEKPRLLIELREATIRDFLPFRILPAVI